MLLLGKQFVFGCAIVVGFVDYVTLVCVGEIWERGIWMVTLIASSLLPQEQTKDHECNDCCKTYS